MNTNPFIKPEVGQQAHTYVSQYVPLPFEMMQKKADIMQKDLDLNNAKGGAIMGMLKVKGLGPKAQAYADAELSKIEDQIRQVSSIGDPTAQSEALNQLGEEVHTRLTRGDLGHIQSQYDAVYGKDQYADQIKKDADRDHITGVLARDYMGRTLSEYDQNFDPKNPTKVKVNPYIINKNVWLEKELQPFAAQIQKKVTETLGPVGSLTYDGITGNFIKNYGHKTEVIPYEYVANIAKGLIGSSPDIQNHLKYNVENLYGLDARKFLESSAIANIAGINTVNNEMSKTTLDRYTNPVGADGRPPKDPNDLNPSFTTPYVRLNPEDSFLNNPDGDQLKLFGEVTSDAIHNMKVSFTDSYKATLNTKNKPSAANIESSIVKTLHGAGLFKGVTTLNPAMEEEFMKKVADGSIKTIYDANGVDVYKNNKPAFIELKRKAESYSNQIEMAELKMQQAMENVGIPDSQKPLIKLASRAGGDAIRAENVFKANLEKIKKDASWTPFVNFKPGMGSLEDQVENMDLSTVNTILDHYKETLNKFPTVKKSLLALKESRTAEMKVKGNMDKLQTELKVMAEGQHTAQESLLTTIKVVNPKGGESIKVNFSDAMADIVNNHQGSFASMSGVGGDGTVSKFTDFINKAVTKMPEYKTADEKAIVGLTARLTKTIATGAKLSGTKDRDGNYQVVFEYGGETLHIPVSFGTSAAPLGGFKINKTLDPAYSSNINAETDVNDALTNKASFTPLGLMSNGVRLETNTGISLLDSHGELVPDGCTVKIDRSAYKEGGKGFFVIPKTMVPNFVRDYQIIRENKGSQAAKEWVAKFLQDNNGI